MKSETLVPKISNGMCHFESSEQYSLFLKFNHKVDLGFLRGFERFKSFKENEYDDNILFKILNKDGCICIGNKIYQLLLNEKQVLAIDKDKFSKPFSLPLPKQQKNRIITKYSFNDDVVGLSESNILPTKAKLFCKDSGCPQIFRSASVNVTNPNGDSGDMDTRIHYLKLGLYFELKAKARIFVSFRTIEIHWDPIYYRQQCGYTAGPMSYWNYVLGNQSGNWLHYLAYQGSKPLTFFHFRIVFMAKYDPNYIYPDPSTDLTIKSGI
jgi:hypothetical protein